MSMQGLSESVSFSTQTLDDALAHVHAWEQMRLLLRASRLACARHALGRACSLHEEDAARWRADARREIAAAAVDGWEAPALLRAPLERIDALAAAEEALRLQPCIEARVQCALASLVVERGARTRALLACGPQPLPGSAAWFEARSVLAWCWEREGARTAASQLLSEAWRDAPRHGELGLEALAIGLRAGESADLRALCRRVHAANIPHARWSAWLPVRARRTRAFGVVGAPIDARVEALLLEELGERSAELVAAAWEGRCSW